MAHEPTTGAFAIVPSNDIKTALPFWLQMGFDAYDTAGDGNFYILTGWGCEIHLRRGDPPPWDVPQNNPFGVFIRTPEVDKIAGLMDEYIIRPGGVLRHREWGLYEVGLAGPDNLLVRAGWPSELVKSR